MLYGGSVNPGNAAELIAQPHVDGLFIGRSAWAAGGLYRHPERASSARAPRISEQKGDAMKIAVAGDSAGADLAHTLAEHSRPASRSAEVSEPQTDAEKLYAHLTDRVASQVKDGTYDRAILVCGTGIGVCISANKVPGIRAALTHDTYSAERAAKSNNAQIITMGARVIGPELAKSIADALLAQTFDENGPLGRQRQGDRRGRREVRQGVSSPARLRRIASITTTAEAAPGIDMPERPLAQPLGPALGGDHRPWSPPRPPAPPPPPRRGTPARSFPAACASPRPPAPPAPRRRAWSSRPGSALPRSRMPCAIACSIATTSASSSAALPLTAAAARISAVA